MRLRLATLALFVAFALPAGGDAALQPRLTVARADPATVQGRHFRPGERVEVTLVMNERRWARTTRAGAAGGFVVVFAGVRLDYCAVPLVLRARGTRTRTVVANLPVRDCAAP